MQRLRTEGEPEAVFAQVQDRLRSLGATPNLIDPVSITILFDMEIPEDGVSRFFLAVLPAGKGASDVALARRGSDRKKAMKSMVLSDDDPIEKRVLHDLLGSGAA